LHNAAQPSRATGLGQWPAWAGGAKAELGPTKKNRKIKSKKKIKNKDVSMYK